jgi:hypothetical protein
MSQTTELKRKVICKRCKGAYWTYLSKKACNNICNDSDCYSKFLERKRSQEIFEQNGK